MGRVTIKIFSKLFISILIPSLVIVLAMALYLHWSFQQGFRQYLNQGEVNKVTELAEQLAEQYQQEQSWGFIEDDPAYWPQFILNWDIGSRRHGGQPNWRTNNTFETRSGARKHRLEQLKFERLFDKTEQLARDSLGAHQLNLMPLGFRVTPYSLNKKPLFRQIELSRFKKDEHVVEWIPIQQEGQTFGWLRLVQPSKSFGTRAGDFLSQQYKIFYWMAGGAFALSLLFSLLLVRHILRPVRLLVRGNQALRKGEFDYELPVLSRDELGDLIQDFNSLAKSLAEQKQLREQWLADISHELRTPLAVLRAELEAMQDGIRPTSTENMSALHQHIMTLNHLVNDLHQLSISDAGLIKPVEQKVNLSQVIKSTARTMQGRLQEKSLKLGVELPEAEIWIKGSEQLLSQLITNLMENSYRYTDEPGEVVLRMTLKERQRQVQLTLSDSAPGVPPEAMPHLFERLYRVERSRSRELGGSGLGLSICEQIVERHQGTIRAEDSPLGGLSIQIALPLLEAEEIQP